MTDKVKYKSYEAAVERLEQITAQMESGEPGLEEAIKLYTEALEIARFCDQKLNEAEAKIKIIMEKNGLLQEEEFESDRAEAEEE